MLNRPHTCARETVIHRLGTVMHDASARPTSLTVCPALCACLGVNLGGDVANPGGFALIVAQPPKAVCQPGQAVLFGGNAEKADHGHRAPVADQCLPDALTLWVRWTAPPQGSHAISTVPGGRSGHATQSRPTWRPCLRFFSSSTGRPTMASSISACTRRRCRFRSRRRAGRWGRVRGASGSTAPHRARPGPGR